MSRITIKDIAKLLQINPSTVSRALKDHPDVSPETKKSVRQVADELGYQPNFQAIHFRNRRSGLIGLIIPEMNMFFLPSVIQAIEETIRKKGYNLIVFQSNDSLEREVEIVRICQGFSVDGLLISVSKETQDTEHFRELEEDGTPIVFFDRVVQQSGFPQIVIDDKQVSVIAVEHLIKKGYQRICGLFDKPNLSISQQRYRGYKQAMENHGRKVALEYCIFADDMDMGRVLFGTLLHHQEPPDALFVMSDELLAGAMQAINEKGFLIPSQIAIVSISDGKLPYFFNPGITHIRHSGAIVGNMAIDLLFQLLTNPDYVQEINLDLDTPLVKLGSA
ncbi:MAG: LacI family transcriptional regulator [Saprospiraceae bacterium]|nr:MAG: LacI family transcriptional regulator [Saprospiraceae bacterium]